MIHEQWTITEELADLDLIVIFLGDAVLMKCLCDRDHLNLYSKIIIITKPLTDYLQSKAVQRLIVPSLKRSNKTGDNRVECSKHLLENIFF